MCFDPEHACAPPPLFQVANYLDFTPEDTDEDKKRALAEVVGLGDTAWVKVGGVGAGRCMWGARGYGRGQGGWGVCGRGGVVGGGVQGMRVITLTVLGVIVCLLLFTPHQHRARACLCDLRETGGGGITSG
jgi:hypothetical protein